MNLNNTQLILVFLFTSFLGIGSAKANETSPTKPEMGHQHRMQMIHQRSSMVMPFEMNKVTHYFVKTKKGGVLKITAKDSNDKTQILLIQKHLHKERERFAKGDFQDPVALHGKNMRGLDVLTKSKDKFSATYKKLNAGARIDFSSKSAAVIKAFHQWFDAQLRDHGPDAKSHF